MTSATIGARVNGAVSSDLRPIVTEDKLELILQNAVETWSQPPRVLTILLADLFASKPEDPLSWIHAQVWRLDREHSSSRPWTCAQHMQIDIDGIATTSLENTRGEAISADVDFYESCSDANSSIPNEILDNVVLDNEVDIDFCESETSPESEQAYPSAEPNRPIEQVHTSYSSEAMRTSEAMIRTSTLEHTMNSMPWIENFKTFSSWVQKTGRASTSSERMPSPKIGRFSTQSASTRGSRSTLGSVTQQLTLQDGIDNMTMRSPMCLMRIDARGKTRFVWNTVFLACLLYEIWAVPFELVVLPKRLSAAWFQIAIVAALPIFLIDIAFSLIVDDDRNRCKQRRCSCVLWIDIVSATSHLACIFIESNVWMRVMLCFRIPRILQLSRTRQWSSFLKASLSRSSYSIFQFVAGYHILALLVSHIDAILWMALQSHHATNTWNEYREYLNSLSLMYAALTWGSDPTMPAAELEAYGIVISAQRLSLLILSFVWLAQQTANSFSNTDVAMKRSEVREYFRSRQVSSKVQAMFMARLAEMNKVSKRQQHLNSFFTAEVPTTLRLKVSTELWQNHLTKFSLLQRLSEWHESFIPELAALVTEDIMASGHVLVKFGDACKNAYLVLSGAFALSEMERPPLADYLPGMWIGEMAFVNPELLHDATLTSKGIVEVMVIRSECFWLVIGNLGVQSMYDTFLQKTVWTGVCGRCGSLGGHFSSSCPTVTFNSPSLTRSLSMKPLALTQSFSLTKSSGAFAPMDSFQADQLLKFLQDIRLERLSPSLAHYGVTSVSDLTIEIAKDIIEDPANSMSHRERRKFLQAVTKLWDVIEKTTSKILAHSGNSNNYLVFISHFKKEAGTEATLMAQELEHIIKSSPSIPGHNLKSPCFVDSDNLRNLDNLEWHLQNSHQLVLLLTPGVLTRPWVLVEIITAFTCGIPIVPVEIQRSDLDFRYPDEAYFERVRQGVELDRDAAALLKEKGFEMEQMEKALRHVFNQIALPFSPHKASGIRHAEIMDVLKQCTLRDRAMRERHYSLRASGRMSATLTGGKNTSRMSVPSRFSGSML